MDDPRPDTPPNPGLLPLALSVGIPAFLLAGFVACGTLLEGIRPGGSTDPVNLLLAALAVFPLTALLALRLDPHAPDLPTLEACGIRPTRTLTAVLALLFGLAVVLPFSELDNLIQGVFPLQPEERASWDRLMAFDGWVAQVAKVLAIAVVTPVGEEVLFRGFVRRWLHRAYGRPAALLGSALLFGAAHLSLRLFATTALLGLFLAWLTDRARSVLPAVATHAAYNAVPFLLPPVVAEAPGMAPRDEVHHLPAAWVLIPAAAALLLLYGIWRSTRPSDD